MQSFAARSPTNQAQDNPLTNHSLLACLIIPHLETYLAAHPDVRFLVLQYPAEYLSTVLALQRLVGADIVKVAGILDGEDSEPVVRDHLRSKVSINKTLSDECLGPVYLEDRSVTSSTSLASLSLQNQTKPFSKANFLLPSSATDSEIAIFVSTIWKILISISSFYVPEHVPRKATSHASLRRPGNIKVPAAVSAIEHTYIITREPIPGPAVPPFVNPPMSPPASIPPMPRLPQRPPSPSDSVRSRISVAASVRSGKSGKTWRTSASTKGHGRRRSQRSRRGRVDMESLYGWVDTDEEDEDYDHEVRRVMPMFVRRRDMQIQKGNSRKALKWLGLA